MAVTDVGGIDGQPTKTEQQREHELKNVRELSLEFDSWQCAHRLLQ